MARTPKPRAQHTPISEPKVKAAPAARRRPGRPSPPRVVPSRALIVHSACTVFNDVGYAAATYNEIAARIGVSRPLVEHHFDSKADLYREAIGQPALAAIEAAQRAAQHATTLPGQLRAFLFTLLDPHAADGPAIASADLLMTSARESLRHPHLASDADTVGALRAFVSTTVHGAAERGEFDSGTDLSVIIDVLASILWGVAIHHGHAGSAAKAMAVIDGLEQLAGSRLWRLRSAQW